MGPVMNSGELLERSLAYALGSVAGVEAGSLGRGTPCAEWDLGELLGHLDDSLEALYEGLTGGRIGLFPRADRVCGFRTRACAVLGAWAAGPAGERVLVGGRPLDVRVMGAVGAVEIAVHGWDVAQACGLVEAHPGRARGRAAERRPLCGHGGGPGAAVRRTGRGAGTRASRCPAAGLPGPSRVLCLTGGCVVTPTLFIVVMTIKGSGGRSAWTTTSTPSNPSPSPSTSPSSPSATAPCTSCSSNAGRSRTRAAGRCPAVSCCPTSRRRRPPGVNSPRRPACRTSPGCTWSSCGPTANPAATPGCGSSPSPSPRCCPTRPSRTAAATRPGPLGAVRHGEPGPRLRPRPDPGRRA